MYEHLMVALDNSEYSNYAADLAIDLAQVTGARLTASHVYAGRLHDTRFRELEPGLPQRYQQEDVLRRQRAIHENLIGRGLGIISASYLTAFENKCRARDIAVERKTREGRNYEELVRDARESNYDLVLIGAHGLGRIERSVIGSVCERVARLIDCDLLVARDRCSLASSRLLVAIDGSPHSFGALRAALDLSRVFGSEVLAVAAYDPFFHNVAFTSIASVLSAEDAKLFRFREQERLHEEVIDKGLTQVYRSHLVKAKDIAQHEGVDIKIGVLEGKPFDTISSYVNRLNPALLLVGRIGIHHGEGVTLGSTAENLLRCAPCNVLVVNRSVSQEPHDASIGPQSVVVTDIVWSAEAERRVQRIPWFVRKMARRRIEEFARGLGHAEITMPVYEQALQHLGK